MNEICTVFSVYVRVTTSSRHQGQDPCHAKTMICCKIIVAFIKNYNKDILMTDKTQQF